MIDKVFSAYYKFYKNVVKESDPFMMFYYAAFAISLTTFFYIYSLLTVLYFNFHLPFLRFSSINWLVTALIVCCPIMIYFYKRRAHLENKAGYPSSTFVILLAWAYFLGGQAVGIYSTFYLKQNL
ncbi:hypothetical protein GGR28_002191 [Lewinella aquimaris]|uniref:Uncharacterized protein n=1 Tax=Neolewinella aquimaris TaxID=1835722 RepID=A0A840EF53_9BACT|nr:hypothetical protein [Neolewinella aquimaris]